VQIRCLNITPLKREVRERLLEERGLRKGAPVKCNWRHEVSRTERPDVPAPSLPERKEQPVLQQATETVEHTVDQIRTFVNLVDGQGWQIKKAAEALGIPLPRAWTYLTRERQRREGSERHFLDDSGRMVDEKGAPVLEPASAPTPAAPTETAAEEAQPTPAAAPCPRCGGDGPKTLVTWARAKGICGQCMHKAMSDGHKRRKKPAPRAVSAPCPDCGGSDPKFRPGGSLCGDCHRKRMREGHERRNPERAAAMRHPSTAVRRSVQPDVDTDDPVAKAVQLLGSMRARDLSAQPEGIKRAVDQLLTAWREM